MKNTISLTEKHFGLEDSPVEKKNSSAAPPPTNNKVGPFPDPVALDSHNASARDALPRDDPPSKPTNTSLNSLPSPPFQQNVEMPPNSESKEPSAPLPGAIKVDHSETLNNISEKKNSPHRDDENGNKTVQEEEEEEESTEEWEDMFHQLTRYKKINHECLHRWVQKQRRLFGKHKMSRKHVDRLNAANFDFEEPENTSDLWDIRYKQLEDYKKKFGNCHITERYCPNPDLGRWADEQRELKKRNDLPIRHFKRLCKLGFHFNIWSDHWGQRYLQLVEFHETHGHCDVPKQYEINKPLGFWVNNQRLFTKTRTLSKERYDLLRQLDFDFQDDEFCKLMDDTGNSKEKESGSNPSPKKAGVKKEKLDDEAVWEMHYQDLLAFKEKHGHCKVPTKYDPNPALARWARNQRLDKEAGNLTSKHLELLTNIGYEFDLENRRWDKRFEELVKFKEENGHVSVPRQYPGLGFWAKKQRTLHRQNELAADKVDRLHKLGFVFLGKHKTNRHINNERFWEERFNDLVAFKEKYGHTRIPRYWPENKTLSLWVESQRQFKRGGNLSAERTKRLDKLGFEWELRSKRWDCQYRILVQFHKEHGHCRVPERWPPHPNFDQWVRKQRRAHRDGKLSEERYEQLSKLGFEWGDGRRRKTMKTKEDEKDTIHKNEDLTSSIDNVELLGKNLVHATASLSQEATSAPQNPSHQTIAPHYTNDSQQHLPPTTHHPMPIYHAPIASHYNPHSVHPSPPRYHSFTVCYDIKPPRQSSREKLTWETQYQDLVSFKYNYGHCNVPMNYSPNPSLGQWVMDQRLAMRDGKLSEDRLLLLYNIEFDFQYDNRTETRNFHRYRNHATNTHLPGYNKYGAP